MLVQDGRHIGKQRSEVIADGENILMAGIIVMHQLSDPNTVLGQRKVFYYIDVLKDFLPKVEQKRKRKRGVKFPLFYQGYLKYDQNQLCSGISLAGHTIRKPIPLYLLMFVENNQPFFQLASSNI